MIALIAAVAGFFIHKKYRTVDGKSFNPLADRNNAVPDYMTNNNHHNVLPPAEADVG